MRSGNTVTESDYHAVQSLLLEVHHLRLRTKILNEQLSKIPGIRNPLAPPEVIENSLKEALTLKRKLDIDLVLFNRLKEQLRRRGYTW